ncbi:MAG: ABC transporter ATP-binding protein [Microthrixaceae bacterium]
MTTITASGLRRVFEHGNHEVVAIDDISLAVPAGEFVTITGPSGSGKSTLLQLLGLIDRPSAGSLHLNGVDTADLSDDERSEHRRRRCGFVFQSFMLLEGLTAWENVALPALLDHRPAKGRRERALELLDEVGLARRADHRPDELSGGEQQRVAIARALMADPDVIYADEPTGALDQHTATEVMEQLVRLTVGAGHTLIVITHDPTVASLAPSHGGRSISLLDGRIDEVVPSRT